MDGKTVGGYPACKNVDRCGCLMARPHPSGTCLSCRRKDAHASWGRVRVAWYGLRLAVMNWRKKRSRNQVLAIEEANDRLYREGCEWVLIGLEGCAIVA